MGFIARQWGSPSVKANKNKCSISMKNEAQPGGDGKGGAGSVFPQLSMDADQWKKQSGSFEPTGMPIDICGSPGDQPLDLDMFLSRLKTHMFSISCMAFQDAWNVDLERVRDCCIHVLSPQGKLIPFCMYNLTDVQGKSLYRKSGPDLISDGDFD